MEQIPSHHLLAAHQWREVELAQALFDIGQELVVARATIAALQEELAAIREEQYHAAVDRDLAETE